jgi:hypothetical protein
MLASPLGERVARSAGRGEVSTHNKISTLPSAPLPNPPPAGGGNIKIIFTPFIILSPLSGGDLSDTVEYLPLSLTLPPVGEGLRFHPLPLQGERGGVRGSHAAQTERAWPK